MAGIVGSVLGASGIESETFVAELLRALRQGIYFGVETRIPYAVTSVLRSVLGLPSSSSALRLVLCLVTCPVGGRGTLALWRVYDGALPARARQANPLRQAQPPTAGIIEGARRRSAQPG